MSNDNKPLVTGIFPDRASAELGSKAAAGAGVGGAVGGTVGAPVGWSIPEELVKEYEEGIQNGGILMGVHPRNAEDASYLEKSWRQPGTQNAAH